MRLVDLKSSINDFWRTFNRRSLNNDTSILELRIIGNAPSIISLAESPSKSARFHLIFETIPSAVVEKIIITISDICECLAIWHKLCVCSRLERLSKIRPIETRVRDDDELYLIF